MDCSPPDSTCLWEFPGKNTGVGCHFLLWGNLPKIKVLTEFDPFGGCEGRMCYCPLSRLVDGHLLPGFVSVQATGLANWRVYVVRPYNRTTRGKVNIWQACQKVCNTTIRKPGNNLFFISNYRSALCLDVLLNVISRRRKLRTGKLVWMPAEGRQSILPSQEEWKIFPINLKFI